VVAAVALVPQVLEVGQCQLVQVQPALLGLGWQLLGGEPGEFLGVAVGTAAAEQEQERMGGGHGGVSLWMHRMQCAQ
jgi:hypothetical protein